MAMIFGFSSLSRPPQPPGGISNYMVHFTVYAGLGLLTARALAAGFSGDVTRRVVGGAVLISSIYGVTDEIHQLFVPDRTFELLDIGADAIGAMVGASALGAWSIIRRRFETPDVL